MPVQNRLAEIRQKRGISAAALARQADVRRQTIYAIEAGTYIPNTVVALRLAQVLEVSVEEIFRLEDQPSAPQSFAAVEVIGADGSPQPGQPVRLCRVGNKMIGVLSLPTLGMLPPADGVCVKTGRAHRATVHSFAPEEDSAKRLLIAGCDPAVSILAQFVAKEAGVELVAANCSSMQAIEWLKQGKVHIAGSHLRDPKTGESNLPIVRRWFPNGGYKVITFAQWEQGLVVAKGNPKQIREVADLARKGVRLINREKGSGSRFLLDESLDKAGIEVAQVQGYNQAALGHIPAAWHIYSSQADCCLATRAAARLFGLDFIPHTTERYDLILREQSLKLRPVEALLDVLNRSAFQHALETLGHYDMTQTGRVLV